MPRWRRSPRQDGGFTVIWVVGVTVGMIAMVGLVVDGGTILRARSQLHSTAAAAGRAAAQEIDEDALLGPGGRPRLDQQAAEAVALRYLRPRGFSGDRIEISFDDSGERITVQLTDRVTLQVFSGVSDDITMAATTRTAEA